MTSFTISRTTEADVLGPIEDALTIPVTFPKDEAVRNAEADSTGGSEMSEDVTG